MIRHVWKFFKLGEVDCVDARYNDLISRDKSKVENIDNIERKAVE